MTGIAALVADNLDLWTSAVARKSGAGRGSSKKVSLYGIDRLRTLILDLAVRGKLVPQEERDEPSDMLLKQIAEGRLQLIKAGFIRGSKAASVRANVTGPFAIPSSWVWVRLDQLGAIVGGGTPPANDQTNFAAPGQGIPWLTPADLSGYEGKYIASGQRDLTEKGAATSSAKVMPAGTVLFTSRAPIGYVAIAANPIATNQGFKSVVPAIDGLSEYIALTLTAFAEEIDANAPGTTFKEVSGKIVETIPFPLPPLAEQQRIVAKVDELMALCDTLETQSALALEAHQALVETLLATLVNSADASDLATNWARLQTHFDALFITEASIDSLKQAVLGLAVRGKLVEQHAADEPAIQKLEGQHVSPPFAIPANWQCVPLQAMGRQVGGGTPSKARPDFWDGPIPWVSPKDMKRDYLATAEMSVSEAALEGSAVKLIAAQSLMFVVRGMILAHSFPVAIAKAPVTINQDMKAIELDQPAMAEYLLRALKGLKPLMLARVERSSHGTCRLDAAAYGSFPIPVPPLAEQHRIVAKVEELMTLCDALKARLVDAAETQKHLADAVVERAAA